MNNQKKPKDGWRFLWVGGISIAMAGGLMAILLFTLMLTPRAAIHRSFFSETPSISQMSPLSVEPDRIDQQKRRFIGIPDAKIISVQNIYSTVAAITTTFRSYASIPDIVVAKPIAPESNQYYSATSEFSGSATIEFEGPVAAVNFQLTEFGNDAYLGIGVELESQTHQAVGKQRLGKGLLIMPGLNFIPYLLRDSEWDTTFGLQNLSSSNASVAISFYLSDGRILTSQFFLLPAMETVLFSASELLNGTERYVGGAAIASDQPLIIASNIRLENKLKGIRASYPAASNLDFSTSWVVPALFNQYDLQSSELCTINSNSVDINIEVHYSDGITRTASLIKPGAPICFQQGFEGHGIGWAGGATVTATHPIPLVVIVSAATDNGKEVGKWAYTPSTRSQTEKRTIGFPFLIDGPQQWQSTLYLYNDGVTDATITPRIVDRLGYIPCGKTITLATGAFQALALAQAAPFFEEGMGYFTSTVPIAVAAGGTSGKALSDISDRHFGYEAAYYGEELAQSTRPCSSTQFAFLPLVLR